MPASSSGGAAFRGLAGERTSAGVGLVMIGVVVSE